MVEPFVAVRARSARDAVGLLGANLGASVIAGGTDLVVKMKDGRARPKVLVSIDAAEDLSGIEDLGDEVWIGAGCTHAQISSSEVVKGRAHLLAAASISVGSPQIRNRGTIGGNIGTGSPAGDAIPALMAMNGRVVAESKRGRREFSAEDFFLGPGRTGLEPDELILGVRVLADRPGDIAAFRKLGQRRAMSISIASVAVHGHLQGGALTDVRVALGSVAPTVVRARALEAALEGKEVTAESLADACALAREAASPIADIRGTREYRLAMVEALTYQALYRAIWPELVDDAKAKWAAEQGLSARGCCGAKEGRGQATMDAATGAATGAVAGAVAGADVDAATGACEGAQPGSIRVKVALFGELSRLAPGGRTTVQLHAGARLADLYGLLLVEDNSYVVALVNQKRQFDDAILADGDEVQLMHPVGGGA
ncbi:MAG: FAD binding domain-containing protein [Clostridia bacterium]|nr:FAD binding domain-containing protein [Clostridia bacterium]